jgi:transposase
MSCIVKSKSGNYTYLYESVSFRNEDGEPRNKRVCIGKVDPKSGHYVFKPEYLERVPEAKKYTDFEDEKRFSISDIKNSVNKEFGIFYLLENIGNRIGLTDVLEKVVPNCWKQILTLAFFMVASGEPAMYCEDWINKSENLPCGSMSSQRISDLLASISELERTAFYESWGKYRSEQEYIALDITSVSSYSELIDDVAWGYNRDKEKLPQINICMLVGEKSRLPIFQVVYNGALKDVSTLKTTLKMALNIDMKNMSIIMDKGFCSKKNINDMLCDEDPFRFLISVPFTLKFATDQVISEMKDIDTIDNTIVVGEDIFRGITKQRSWNKNQKLYTHIFLNADLAYHKRNKLYGHVSELKELAERNPNDKDHTEEFKKYLCIRKSEKSDSNYTISIRKDVVEEQLQLSGWMVSVSNFISTAPEAIKIYRTKDVVEKAFLRLKNCLDLARLRVHSDTNMQNKIFVGFIALIFISYIHKVMDENHLYSAMTMKKMIKKLEALRVQYINGKQIIYPPNLEQKKIFEAFNVELPV